MHINNVMLRRTRNEKNVVTVNVQMFRHVCSHCRYVPLPRDRSSAMGVMLRDMIPTSRADGRYPPWYDTRYGCFAV